MRGGAEAGPSPAQLIALLDSGRFYYPQRLWMAIALGGCGQLSKLGKLLRFPRLPAAFPPLPSFGSRP